MDGNAEAKLGEGNRRPRPALRYVAHRATATEEASLAAPFFDHVLRSDESYSEKWNYVRNNPVRAGLVQNADDWPYAGEIIRIDRV